MPAPDGRRMRQDEHPGLVVDGIEVSLEDGRSGEVAPADTQVGENPPGLLPITAMIGLSVACHIVLSCAQLKCYFHTFVELEATGKSKHG
jgi:hypothetical protein